MTTTQTAVTPTSPAAATALLSFSVPEGGDPRVIAGVTACLQKLLNAASVALKLVTGGSIGNNTGTTIDFRNDCKVSGDFEVAESLVTTGSVSLGKDVQLNVTSVSSGTIAPGSVSTPSGTQKGYFFYAAGNITGGGGAVTYTIDDTNCDDGMAFEVFVAQDATGVLAILDPDSNPLALLAGSAPHAQSYRFRRVGGTWYAMRGYVAL